MADQSNIIVVHESPMQSVIKDTYTFAAVVGIIGVGWLLGSDAMQWIGFVILSVIALARAGSISKKFRYTPQEAADLLRDRWGVVASPSRTEE